MIKNDARSVWRVKTGLLAMALAPLLAIFPFIAGAFLSVIFCTPDANEGNCKWAALPWFMFFTIPAAALVFVAGLVVLIVALLRRKG